jgi:hypothetical protein
VLESKLEAEMITLRRLALFAGAALLGIGVSTTQLEAREGYGGFFFAPFFAPYYEPPPWRPRYYAPPRKRHYAPARRKPSLSMRRKPTQSHNGHQAALALPRKASRFQPPITAQVETTPATASIGCRTSQAIVAEYGFKDVKAEVCTGNQHSFNATRDGKPFWIKIVAGELAAVRRLR